MKKIIAILFMALFLGSNGNAQNIENKDNIIYLGFGIDPFYRGYQKNIGPLMLGYERIITDIIGIGRFGVGGTVAQSWYGGGYGRTALLAKAAYHFDFNVTGLDFYAGAGLGTYFYNFDNHYYGKHSGRVGFGHHIFAGLRYFFTDNVGVWTELGYGYSLLNVGVAFKF